MRNDRERKNEWRLDQSRCENDGNNENWENETGRLVWTKGDEWLLNEERVLSWNSERLICKIEQREKEQHTFEKWSRQLCYFKI